jgi:hypothetical protein
LRNDIIVISSLDMEGQFLAANFMGSKLTSTAIPSDVSGQPFASLGPLIASCVRGTGPSETFSNSGGKLALDCWVSSPNAKRDGASVKASGRRTDLCRLGFGSLGEPSELVL